MTWCRALLCGTILFRFPHPRFRLRKRKTDRHATLQNLSVTGGEDPMISARRGAVFGGEYVNRRLQLIACETWWRARGRIPEILENACGKRRVFGLDGRRRRFGGPAASNLRILRHSSAWADVADRARWGQLRTEPPALPRLAPLEFVLQSQDHAGLIETPRRSDQKVLGRISADPFDDHRRW